MLRRDYPADAMSNPVHPTEHAPSRGEFEINLECQSLESTCREWRDLFGFEEFERYRVGYADETVRMVRRSNPGLVVSFTSCSPRPVVGAVPGCYRRLALTVTPQELRSIASHLKGRVKWVEPPPAEGDEAAWDACKRITASCTSGHILCFAARRPAGCA